MSFWESGFWAAGFWATGFWQVSNDYNLNIESGSFALSGTAVGLSAERELAIASGSIVLNGTDLTLSKSNVYSISLESGTIRLVGTDISLSLVVKNIYVMESVYDEYNWRKVNSITYKVKIEYYDYGYYQDGNDIHVHKIIQSVNSVISNDTIHIHKVIKHKRFNVLAGGAL